MLHAFEKVPFRKGLHVEVFGILRFPQAQNGNRLGIRPGNHHIVGDRFHLFRVVMLDAHAVFRPDLADISVEPDAERLIRTLNQPDVSAGQPDIRQLRLPSVYDFLLKQAILVQDRIAHRRVALRCQRIHKTGRQPSEPSVAQPGIRLQIVEFLQTMAVFFQIGVDCAADPQVVGVVFHGLPHQKLHAEIIDALSVLSLVFFIKFIALFQQNIADRERDGPINLILACLFDRHAEVSREFPLDQGRGFFYRKIFGHSFLRSD